MVKHDLSNFFSADTVDEAKSNDITDRLAAAKHGLGIVNRTFKKNGSEVVLSCWKLKPQ